MPNMAGGELHLVPVFGLLVFLDCHDAGAVDEEVDLGYQRLYFLRGGADRGIRAEVELDEMGFDGWVGFVDCGDDGGNLGLRAACKDDGGGLRVGDARGIFGCEAVDAGSGENNCGVLNTRISGLSSADIQVLSLTLSANFFTTSLPVVSREKEDMLKLKICARVTELPVAISRRGRY